MEDYLIKDKMVERTERARAEWDRLLAQLSDDQMRQPGASGDWTVKDVIAHLAWHEREMTHMMSAAALVGSELWNLPLDARNAAIYAMNKDRGLAEVRAEAEQSYRQSLELMKKLADEDLRDPSRFADMPPDWQPGKVIASNTYEHYEDHIAELRAWLAKTGLVT